MSAGSPITPDPKEEKPPSPPTVIEKSVNPASKPITLTEVLNMIIYILMLGAAVYFGWKIGRQYALQFWMVFQTLGQMLREAIASAIANLRKARAARAQLSV